MLVATYRPRGEEEEEEGGRGRVTRLSSSLWGNSEVTNREQCYRDAHTVFPPGLLSSLLSPNRREVQHVYPRVSRSSLLLHLSRSLLISRPSARPSLSIIPSSRPLLSLSLSPWQRAQTKETESRLQTGVALIKLLKRTCI